MPSDAPAPAIIATAASPWGPIQVVVSPVGLAAAERSWSSDEVVERVGLRLRRPIVPADTAPAIAVRDRLFRAALAAIEALGEGRVVTDEPTLDWTGIAAWDRRVLEGARTLRRGEITSYGRLARRIGAPGAARAVGAALGRNPYWLFVPCHRVVAGDGSIGGYGGGPDALEVKRDLLALEGVAVPVADLVD